MQFDEHLCNISTVLTVTARRISLPMKNLPWKGRGHGHEQFLHCGLRKFRHSKSSIISTTRSVASLFMTPIRQWKRLDHVMVECTCLLHIGPWQPSNFITLICSGLVIQVVYALLRGNWQYFNWHDASRGPSAIAELLVGTDCIVCRTGSMQLSGVRPSVCPIRPLLLCSRRAKRYLWIAAASLGECPFSALTLWKGIRPVKN